MSVLSSSSIESHMYALVFVSIWYASGIRSLEGQPEADSCPKSIPPQKTSHELASSILKEIPRARLRLDIYVTSDKEKKKCPKGILPSGRPLHSKVGDGGWMGKLAPGLGRPGRVSG